MAGKKEFGKGVVLEARIQRLLMCQGALAERALFLRTSQSAPKLVTDVDILAHDYNLNFQEHRIYAECKGGKNVSTLDRIVWIRGVIQAIDADTGILVLDHCDAESVEFARGQGIQILMASGLEALENALGIGMDFWPGRSRGCFFMTSDGWAVTAPGRGV